MVSRWAIIRDGVVENVCLWDGDTSKWKPEAGRDAVPAPDHVGIGWAYDGQDWAEPVVEEVPSE